MSPAIEPTFRRTPRNGPESWQVRWCGMAITAADPSGLWGLLKEAFASGQSLAAKQDASANPLAKLVADDITVPEIRTAARDRLQDQFKGAQIGELDRAPSKSFAPYLFSLIQRRQRTRPASRHGFKRSPRRPRKQATRAGSWASEASRSAKRRKRHSSRFPQRSAPRRLSPSFISAPCCPRYEVRCDHETPPTITFRWNRPKAHPSISSRPYRL